MSEQLGLEGIGQQKYTLADWKRDNAVYTYNAKHIELEDCPWSCWSELEDPCDFVSEYGDMLGYGKSEKEAILHYCEKHELKPPFWW